MLQASGRAVSCDCEVCERYTAGSYRLRYKYGSSKWCCTVCASGDRLCKTNPLYTDHSLSSADPAAQSAVKAQTKRSTHGPSTPALKQFRQKTAIPPTGHYRWVPAGARLAVHDDTPAGTPLPISLSSSSSSSSISHTHTNTHHLRHHHCHRHRPQSEPPTTNRDQEKNDLLPGNLVSKNDVPYSVARWSA